MPSPRAVLIDITEFGLSHHKHHDTVGANGRLKNTLGSNLEPTNPVVESDVEKLELDKEILVVKNLDSPEETEPLEETQPMISTDEPEKRNKKTSKKKND